MFLFHICPFVGSVWLLAADKKKKKITLRVFFHQIGSDAWTGQDSWNISGIKRAQVSTSFKRNNYKEAYFINRWCCTMLTQPVESALWSKCSEWLKDTCLHYKLAYKFLLLSLCTETHSHPWPQASESSCCATVKWLICPGPSVTQVTDWGQRAEAPLPPPPSSLFLPPPPLTPVESFCSPLTAVCCGTNLWQN